MPHTPAPWTATRSFSPSRINKVAANHVLIADCYASERTPAEQEANARLIAAAPELLEALTILLDHAQEQYPHFENPRGQDDINRALAAIAKATA